MEAYVHKRNINYYKPHICLGIYTVEEQQFLKRLSIIGPDVQIPNSVVRHRLGTAQMLMKANMETLHKAFALPDELFMNLSVEHKIPQMTGEDEKLFFNWDDEADNNDSKYWKSENDVIINKKRQKRRKYEDYKYDYDSTEPLSLNEIIEEIRTNSGRDLRNESLKLITEIIQIINRHKKDQIMNIYDEFIDIQLIPKFGDVPTLVQVVKTSKIKGERIYF